jgi:hypothetical protein
MEVEMRRMVWGLAFALAMGSAAAQQVWKCEVDGRVIYTDEPCGKAGRPMPPRSLMANVVDSPPALAASAGLAASGVPEAAEPLAPAASAASVPAAVAQPAPSAPTRAAGRHGRRDSYMSKIAMQGLMDTDFVLRGYMLRRQNPASTPNP